MKKDFKLVGNVCMTMSHMLMTDKKVLIYSL